MSGIHDATWRRTRFSTRHRVPPRDGVVLRRRGNGDLRRDHRLLLEPYLDRIAGQLSPARALDLGCGTGVVSLALANRGFDVVGVDHSQDMLGIAEQKLAAAHLPGAWHFVVGDVRKLAMGDDQFECVTCQGLLHHLGDFELCLRELARVLRPGGYFYISEPCNDATPLQRALRALWRAVRVRRQPPEAEKPESVEEPNSAQELRAALGRLGLEFDMQFLTRSRCAPRFPSACTCSRYGSSRGHGVRDAATLFLSSGESRWPRTAAGMCLPRRDGTDEFKTAIAERPT